MDHGRGRGIAAVAAGAIVVLSACSPGGGAADDRAKPAPGPGTPTAPPGFSLERAGAVFLARPDEWTPGDGATAPGAALALHPPDAAGAYPALIAVYVEEGFEGTFEEYRFTFNAESNTALPGREVTEETPTTVPGAERALLIEAEYAAPDDDVVVIRQLDLLLVTADGTTADVRASATAEEFDALRPIFTEILQSVVVDVEGTSA
jgi:hypothetical protein